MIKVVVGKVVLWHVTSIKTLHKVGMTPVGGTKALKGSVKIGKRSVGVG